MGGLKKDVEAVSTGGGTRSINVAFETVLRSLPAGFGRPRVLTGNPHLAVERAERRFGFALLRVFLEGQSFFASLLRRNVEQCQLVLQPAADQSRRRKVLDDGERPRRRNPVSVAVVAVVDLRNRQRKRVIAGV